MSNFYLTKLHVSEVQLLRQGRETDRPREQRATEAKSEPEPELALRNKPRFQPGANNYQI